MRAEPDARHARLSDCDENEAYVTRIDGVAYAVYFPDGGDVRLAVSPRERHALTWLDIAAGTWTAESAAGGGRYLRLKTPGRGHWLALVRTKRPLSSE